MSYDDDDGDDDGDDDDGGRICSAPYVNLQGRWVFFGTEINITITDRQHPLSYVDLTKMIRRCCIL